MKDGRVVASELHIGPLGKFPKTTGLAEQLCARCHRIHYYSVAYHQLNRSAERQLPNRKEKDVSPFGIRCLISSTQQEWSGQRCDLLLLDDLRLSAYALLRHLSHGADQPPAYYAIQRLAREAARREGLILYIIASREEGWQWVSSVPHSSVQDALAEVLTASGPPLVGEVSSSFQGLKGVKR